ncbi:MAG: TniQ family protein [Rhodospirillaceae bacterium]|nr:TniQ family protein [Rhodospirillaceae bacterium]
MTSYPLRIIPGPNESVRSIMHRLSKRNGFEKISWLMHDIGCRKMTSALSSFSVRKLSGLSGISARDLERRQEAKTKRVTTLNGHNVPLGSIDRLHSRLCLRCFASNQQHFWTWDYLPLTHCPIHAEVIIRHCPNSNIPLHWHRATLTECPIGHSLLAPQICLVSDPSTIPVNRAILDLMTSVETEAGDRPSLQELVTVAEILGCIGYDKESAGKMNSQERYLDPLYKDAMARGFEVMQDVRSRLPSLLDRLFNARQSTNFLLAGSSAWRTKLHNRLCHYSEFPFVNTISRILWKYGEERRISFPPGAFGWTPTGFGNKFIAATAARDLLKMDMKSVAKVARRENWVGAQQILSGTPSWLLRSEVMSWISQNEKLLTATSTALRLGITKETLCELNQLGVFGVAASSRKNLSPLMPRLRRQELDDFIVALKCLAIDGTDTMDSTSWMALTKRPESMNLSFARVVSEILKGQIRVYSPIPAELPKVRFSFVDAAAISRSIGGSKTARLGSAERTLSIREASVKYKLGYSRMQQAIEYQLIAGCQPGFGITKGYVTDQAMVTFLQNFTTSRIVADMIGSTTMSVTMTLKRLGVKSVQAKRTGVTGNDIFSWADVKKIGLTKLKTKTKPKDCPTSTN